MVVKLRRGWQAAVAGEERRASPSPVESVVALAATRARRTRRYEYHLPNSGRALNRQLSAWEALRCSTLRGDNEARGVIEAGD